MKTLTNLFNHRDATTAARAFARGLQDERVRDWFDRTASRWLRQRPDCAVPVPPGTPDLPKWAAEDIAAGRCVHRFVLSDEARDTLINISHWLKLAIRAAKRSGGSDLGKLAARDLAGLAKTTVEAAEEKANGWFRREANAARRTLRAGTAPADALELIPASGHHVWERVSTRGMLELGTELKNCLRYGTYKEEVKNGSLAVWGLRSPRGRYVVALSVNTFSKSVTECKGDNNQPATGYARHVLEFMKALKLSSQASDLLKIGILDGQLIEDLPADEILADGARIVWALKSETMYLVRPGTGPEAQTTVIKVLNIGMPYNHVVVQKSVKPVIYPAGNLDLFTREEVVAIGRSLASRNLDKLALAGVMARTGSYLVYKGGRVVPWPDAITRQVAFPGGCLVELEDGRALMTSPHLLEIGRYIGDTPGAAPAPGEKTTLSATNTWNWPKEVRDLLCSDPAAFMEALDPTGERIRTGISQDLSRITTFSLNGTNHQWPTMVRVARGWVREEDAWVDEGTFLGGTVLWQRLRAKGLDLSRLIDARGKEIGRVRLSAGSTPSATLHGEFCGLPELVAEVMSRIAGMAGSKVKVNGAPDWMVQAADGTWRPLSAKPVQLEGGGVLLKANRRWYGRSDDGTFLWRMGAPRKLAVTKVELIGDAPEAAQHLARLSSQMGLSLPAIIDWLADAGYGVVNGTPVRRAFPALLSLAVTGPEADQRNGDGSEEGTGDTEGTGCNRDDAGDEDGDAVLPGEDAEEATDEAAASEAKAGGPEVGVKWIRKRITDLDLEWELVDELPHPGNPQVIMRRILCTLYGKPDGSAELSFAFGHHAGPVAGLAASLADIPDSIDEALARIVGATQLRPDPASLLLVGKIWRGGQLVSPEAGHPLATWRNRAMPLEGGGNWTFLGRTAVLSLPDGRTLTARFGNGAPSEIVLGQVTISEAMGPLAALDRMVRSLS